MPLPGQWMKVYLPLKSAGSVAQLFFSSAVFQLIRSATQAGSHRGQRSQMAVQLCWLSPSLQLWNGTPAYASFSIAAWRGIALAIDSLVVLVVHVVHVMSCHLHDLSL